MEHSIVSIAKTGFADVHNKECIPRVDVFFLPDPKDRLRLSFLPLLSQCKYIHATVGYGRKRIVYLYMEGSEAGWMWARNVLEPGRLN